MGLSRWETLGAWLGVWTPPRGAEVPPVPRRAIAAGAALAVVVLAAAAALLVGSDGDDGVQGRAAAERRAEMLASVDREQRPRTGTGRRDLRRASRVARIGARTRLVARARAAIVADAARRGVGTIRGADCDPFPRRPGAADPAERLGRSAAAYQCVAVTSRFHGGVIGIPFRLIVRFAAGRYAFCRIVPLADRDRLSHPLPEACRL